MTDIALAWNADAFAADLVLEHGELLGDEGMRTAILISLFTDARAPDGAQLPEDGADRRGWWGDDFAAGGSAAGTANAIGSTLWLLRRAKRLPQVLVQAREAAHAALAWLVRDGIASAVQVEAEALPGHGGDLLAIRVGIDRPQGKAREFWDFTWNASTGALAA